MCNRNLNPSRRCSKSTNISTHSTCPTFGAVSLICGLRHNKPQLVKIEIPPTISNALLGNHGSKITHDILQKCDIPAKLQCPSLSCPSGAGTPCKAWRRPRRSPARCWRWPRRRRWGTRRRTAPRTQTGWKFRGSRRKCLRNRLNFLLSALLRCEDRLVGSGGGPSKHLRCGSRSDHLTIFSYVCC